MANYIKATNFAVKDSLTTGDPAKVVKGTEIDTELNNIASAITSKADLVSPAFTGTPTAPTPSTVTENTQIATTAYVANKIGAIAAGVTSFSAGSTGLTPSTGTTGNVTLGGTLALANGGTGATTASSARDNLDVPTRNGTGASGTWGISISGNAATATTATSATTATNVTNVTTNQVLSATAGASVGAVGTYAFLRDIRDASGSATSPGNTLAGSNLRYAGVVRSGSLTATQTQTTGSALSGTWRCMGYCAFFSNIDETNTGTTLWLRIS